MTTDAQTQGTARVPMAVIAATDAEVAPPSPVEDDRTESIDEMYEAGMARLGDLHDRWAAAVAEIGQTQAGGEPWNAAA